MKRLIVITMVLAFVGFSCRSGKDLNIHVDHSKEKNQYKKSDKKYKSSKRDSKTIKKL